MPATTRDLLERARAGLSRLSPGEAWEALGAGTATLIDTRCAEALDRDGEVPGAIHVPLSVLYWRADPTSGHDDPRISGGKARLVVLCADGYSSSLAAATLQELGHADATDVAGGFTAWRAAGLPIAPRARSNR